ncbi:MAG TPA: hypothetical protein PLX08_10190 [Bacteroidales bacterium]|nr:hypothetical protein [Bacteroidales bacterium]
MKKLLFSIGSILIMTLVVVLFINAADSGKDKKKPLTEVKAGDESAPCSARCGAPEGTNTSKCRPAHCTESAGQARADDCDRAACHGAGDAASKESKPCPASASCAQTCRPTTNGIK